MENNNQPASRSFLREHFGRAVAVGAGMVTGDLIMDAIRGNPAQPLKSVVMLAGGMIGTYIYKAFKP